MLALSYAVAFIDRQVLNLVVDPIKASLRLSDVDISLLQGLAFMTAYMVMGFVFGRLADLRNRRNLLIFAVSTWSVSTVACALPTSFFGFFAARLGIGAAEACLLPAAWSLLADYFSRERLPRAMSVFVLGPFVGGGLALIFGGLVLKELAHRDPGSLFAAVEPWRAAFVCVGLPGLLVAAALLIVREPPRRLAAGAVEAPFSIVEVCRYFWRERAFYGGFIGGIAFLVVGVYALPAWTPAFLIRAHGAAAASVGVQYGAFTLVTGCLGVLAGPWVTAALARRFPADAAMRTAVLAALGTALACLGVQLASGYWIALVSSALASGLVNMVLPVAAAAIQSATPNRMRGVATSVYALTLNGVGLGCGPTAVALITDHVLRDPQKVGTAMAIVVAAASFCAVPLLVFAARARVRRVGAAAICR
jgi:MFS family permease